MIIFIQLMMNNVVCSICILFNSLSAITINEVRVQISWLRWFQAIELTIIPIL